MCKEEIYEVAAHSVHMHTHTHTHTLRQAGLVIRHTEQWLVYMPSS